MEEWKYKALDTLYHNYDAYLFPAQWAQLKAANIVKMEKRPDGWHHALTEEARAVCDKVYRDAKTTPYKRTNRFTYQHHLYNMFLKHSKEFEAIAV